MIQPSYFYIPPEIEAGLLAGNLIRHAGTVRDQMGRIVKLLDEVSLPGSNEMPLADAPAVLKNPRVLIPAFVVGGVAVGAAAILTARKRRREIGKPEAPGCVERCNTSLAAYVEGVYEGRLELETIERLIADLDTVRAYSGEDGGVTLGVSIRHTEMLINVVARCTRQLAEANSVDLKDVQVGAQSSGNTAVADLRRHLEVQRTILSAAA